MTSERPEDHDVNGRRVRVWKQHGRNEVLDCRVYALASLEALGAINWEALRARCTLAAERTALRPSEPAQQAPIQPPAAAPS